ncbi:succinate dehydrogenase assembly factor 2 [Phenylobacterium sp.]|uniref:FAD assembly factor SdhE n=1 Tax=Phenylobacterium sp. TaxID=1871053 RepID=UPI00272F978F|nr:succinate dehydrogenase assembly factor 2 [Phenylobacterium sp.]MDP1874551.1 succinate dehydrogenase assembly factor 2 [Phenylobacterium sp.]MDP3489268.1 succinate dehydrogenase assembly factor 2 [Phenylobacterium sp.]
MASTHDIRLKRLKFRSWHRGFVEADLILGGFVDRHAKALSEAQLDILEHLLDQPDHDIYAWIVERSPTPPEFDTEIMTMIRVFRDEAHKTIGGQSGG